MAKTREALHAVARKNESATLKAELHCVSDNKRHPFRLCNKLIRCRLILAIFSALRRWFWFVRLFHRPPVRFHSLAAVSFAAFWSASSVAAVDNAMMWERWQFGVSAERMFI